MDAKLASWYATLPRAVRCQLTDILEAEWRGILGRSWNYERLLFFAHIFLTMTLGVYKSRKIRSRITSRIEIWYRGIHLGLMGDVETEGAAQEGRATRGGDEEATPWKENSVESCCWGNFAMRYFGKPTGVGGCLLPGYLCTKSSLPVAYVVQENQPKLRVNSMENPTCANFKEYMDVPKTSPLEFTEDDLTC